MKRMILHGLNLTQYDSNLKYLWVTENKSIVLCYRKGCADSQLKEEIVNYFASKKLTAIGELCFLMSDEQVQQLYKKTEKLALDTFKIYIGKGEEKRTILEDNGYLFLFLPDINSKYYSSDNFNYSNL